MASQSGETTAAQDGQATHPRNIVLCSDGTGNRGGKGNGTNVWAFYQALDRTAHRTAPDKTEQLAYYDDGVGSEDFKLFKILGGAFGWGLSRNIRDLYTYLVNNYRPGDRIFLFGFSRGAFTVRSLAGLISSCGIWKRPAGATWEDVQAGVRQAWAAYREEWRARRPFLTRLSRGRWERGRSRGIAAAFKQAHGHDATIRCVGVWDTVDAIGVPFDGLRVALDIVFCNQFHQHDLGPGIEHGFHALAIDDERKTFHPVMWNENLTRELRAENPPVVQQVWFAGAHSNVGGGYPKQGLARFGLHWMMERAHDCGLHFKRDARTEAWRSGDVDDRLYDSRAGLAAYYRYMPRDIERLTAENCVGKARVHASVFERIDHGPVGYAPGNLPHDLALDETGYTLPTEDVGLQGAKRVLARAAEACREVDDRLLHRTRRLWKTRIAMHWALVAFTLAFLAGCIALHRRPPEAAGDLSLAGRIVDGLLGFLGGLLPWDAVQAGLQPVRTYFASHPERFAGVVAVLALIVWIGRACRARMERTFADFWARSRG